MSEGKISLFIICLLVLGAFSTAVAATQWPVDFSQQATYNQFEPDAAWGTSNWLVVWEENDEVNGLRLDVGGMPLDCGMAISDPSSASIQDVAVSYGNGFWLVVWSFSEYISGEQREGVRAQRIASDGSKIGATQTLTYTTTNMIKDTDVAWGLDSWRVVWAQSDSITYCVRSIVVNADGSTQSVQSVSSCQTVGAFAWQPAIARGNDDWLVVYPEGSASGYDYLRAKIIPYDGGSWSQNIIDWGTYEDHSYPAIALGNSEWLVTWTDHRNSTLDIYAQRRDMSGAAIGGAFPVFQSAHDDTLSAVAYSSGRYQVAVEMDDNGNDDIVGQRVNVDGTLDGSAFYMGFSAADQSAPTITAGNGGTFLNPWSDMDLGLRTITGRINTNSSGGGTNFVIGDTDGNGCDDGLFCTGTETCDGGQCVSSGDPCRSDETCDEVNDMCVPEITCGSVQQQKKAQATNAMMLMLMLVLGAVVIAKRAARRK